MSSSAPPLFSLSDSALLSFNHILFQWSGAEGGVLTNPLTDTTNGKLSLTRVVFEKISLDNTPLIQPSTGSEFLLMKTATVHIAQENTKEVR